jgi:tight adherence protein C
MNWLPILAAVCAALAVYFALVALLALLASRKRKKTLAKLSKYTSESIATQVAPTSTSSQLFFEIGHRLANSRYQKYLQSKLEAAGRHGTKALSGLLYQKGFYLAVGIVFGVLVSSLSPQLGAAYILILPVLAFFVPDILLVDAAQKRVDEIDLGLAEAIDLLNLCVESGLTFEAAIARVSVGIDGPVAEEFGAIQGEMQLGKSRAEALQSAAERTKSQNFQRIITSLQQVDRLGIPMSTVLREQTKEMRAARKDKAREQAQKVTIKVLPPLILCLLPAMFIIVIGPAVVRLLTSFAQIGH